MRIIVSLLITASTNFLIYDLSLIVLCMLRRRVAVAVGADLLIDLLKVLGGSTESLN